MQPERRFSRHGLQQIGRRASYAFLALSVISVIGVIVLALMGKSPPSFEKLPFFRYSVILGLFYITQRKFKWLLWLHEGAHIGYACFRGVPCNRIGYVAKPKQPGVAASLNLANVPKDVWVSLTLAPLVFPLILIALGFLYPPIGLLALPILPGSFNDLVYVFAVLRAPGRFVTLTNEEVIVSWTPLSDVPGTPIG